MELADTLVADFDSVEFLHTLTERCVELLGVEAAGLLLADGRGALRLVAASTDEVQVLELFQLQQEEGPCLDSYRSGRVVTLSDATRPEYTDRWPRFSATAADVGFAGVHAIPMRLREDVIGTLNLFRVEANELDEASARLGRALVDVATIGILQERAVRTARSCRMPMVATSTSALPNRAEASSSSFASTRNRFSVPMTSSRSRIGMACTPAKPTSAAVAENRGQRSVYSGRVASERVTTRPLR